MDGQDKLREIAVGFVAGDIDNYSVTVRDFLSWFDAKRRGVWVVSQIRDSLNEVGIKTVPDFESAYIDSYITFVRSSEVAASGSAGDEEEVSKTVVGVDVEDPTYKLRKLASANNSPISVTPQDKLETAVTKMMANDFSQLPIMCGESQVKGIISWKSIGSELARGRAGNECRQFKEQVKVVPIEASIFSVIKTITDENCVLVEGDDKKISGIITAYDLSEQFGVLSKPFMLLGEIEGHLRKLLSGKFSKEQLENAKNPENTERAIDRIEDLTFGEYLRIVENPAFWDELGLNLDRKVFVSELEPVRKIRNNVMHFDPDGLDDEDLRMLERVSKFLQKLDRG